jgi:NAD(P)H-hydrate epimerase
VQVHTWVALAELKGDARAMAQACQALGVGIHVGLGGWQPGPGLVLVDALLGTGVSRAPEGELAQAIAAMNGARAHGARVVAVDQPSGMDADTGMAAGACVQADVTATFAPLKPGLLADGALEAVGELRVEEIGVPVSMLDAVRGAGPRLESIDLPALARKLGKRPAAGFKGTFGHVLLVGGGPGKGGALGLSALAALRAGAGLVTVAAREAEVRAAQALAPELMGHVLAGAGPLVLADLEALLGALGERDVGVLGPGLEAGPETGALLRAVLEKNPKPMVLDAGALAALGPKPPLRPDVVITPHAGEAGRLLGQSSREVQANRLASAQALHAATGAVCVLKGARTLVASEGRVAFHLDGSPLLGTAGSGDVLAGVVGALLARRKLSTADAAALAVALHGTLGGCFPGLSSVIATDLIHALPRRMHEVGL